MVNFMIFWLDGLLDSYRASALIEREKGIHYNPNITLTHVALAAYDYIVNGKPAIDWVMERQAVKVDKDSGIVNDANDYATETVRDPRYPFDLLCRVITVSLETMEIVRSQPPLEI